MDKVQILKDEKGEPAFAVVPWKDFERMKAAGDEDKRLIALANPHRDEEAFPVDVAKRLIAGTSPTKVFREWRGMTQQELSTKSGVANQYISQIERKVRNVGRAVAKRLAGALGVDAEDLMD